MKYKEYSYPSIKVEFYEKRIRLSISDINNVSFEQEKLFSSILNFGYIGLKEGFFVLTDRQILDFWDYANSSVLKNMKLAEYYTILGLHPLYDAQIPTIKEKETFISDSYQMTVAWINDVSTGKMASAPKAYRRNGLEIVNFEDEIIGSLFPEYYRLYELIDEANNKWSGWNKKERYNFLEKVFELNGKRKISIPDSLIQTFEHIKPN